MTSLQEKECPDWVHPSIWEIYLEFKREEIRNGDSDGFYSQKLDMLIADRRCAVVWKALAKRARTKFKSSGEEFEDFERSDFDYPLLRILISRIPIFAWGLRDEDRVPPATRAHQGKKIARAAIALRVALFEAKYENEWPNRLYSNFFRNLPNQLGDICAVSASSKDVFRAPDTALGDLCNVLSVLESAAKSWSSRKPVVVHTGSPNADRLFFIREMTTIFRLLLHSPLREPVAALASVLFEGEVDAATVAKLAP